MKTDQQWMQHAITLAEHGMGSTHPNPRVGAVVVSSDGMLLGEGWHARAGLPHAEPLAIADAIAKHGASSTHGATIYITLEPCASQGRTPPCTQAIVSAGISRVVYASFDPNPDMAGGAEHLRAQGLRVDDGLLRAEADAINAPFFHALRTGLPYVIAKAAMSLDGKLATHTYHSQWISGELSRCHAHGLRAQSDAVVVGAGTLLHDNPSLTVRGVSLCGDIPLRVVIADEAPAFFADAHVLDDQAPSRLYVCSDPHNHIRHWRDAGMDVVEVTDLHAAFQHLAQEGRLQVLVEGGGHLHASLLEQQLVSELVLYQAPILIGGTGAVGFWQGLGSARVEHAVRLADVQREMLGDDQMIRGRVVYASC